MPAHTWQWNSLGEGFLFDLGMDGTSVFYSTPLDTFLKCLPRRGYFVGETYEMMMPEHGRLSINFHLSLD